MHRRSYLLRPPANSRGGGGHINHNIVVVKTKYGEKKNMLSNSCSIQNQIWRENIQGYLVIGSIVGSDDPVIL